MGILFCLFGRFELRGAGRQAAPFLLIAPGARTAALGEAFAGLAEGIETLSSNPAGLGREKEERISLQHLFFVDGILYDNLFYLHPVQKGAWGVQAGFLNVKKLKKTIADPSAPDGYQEIGDFSTHDLQGSFSYGRSFGKTVDLGATARFFRESVSDASAPGFGLDLGFLYSDPAIPLKFGASIQHLGPKIKYQNESFSLPGLLRAGVSLRQNEKSPLKWIPLDSALSVEVSRSWDGENQSASGGIEVPFLKSLTARAGYRFPVKSQNLGYQLSVPKGFAMGFGLNLTLWNLDYAVTSFGDLGLTHHVSLSLKFKEKEAEQKQ